MEKQVQLSDQIGIPMPVTLVGTVIEGKANFMTVAWCTRIANKPPMVAMSINKRQYSAAGIIANKAFSLCLVDGSMEAEADYCGIVSGRNVDKSGVFELFNGSVANAPMISRCPINMECELEQMVELPSNYLFIANIVNTYARADVLENGKPVLEKINPMVLTMPDNRYWKLGNCVGHAWKDGLALKKD